MRVIGGKLRGKLIHNPTDKTTRPLKDMVRESIFNILEHSSFFMKGYTWSPSTRFRWLQTSQTPEAWLLDNVYIGNECPGACLGHGKCRERSCMYCEVLTLKGEYECMK